VRCARGSALAGDAVTVAIQVIRVGSGDVDRSGGIARTITGAAGAIDIRVRRDARRVPRSAVGRRRCLGRCCRASRAFPCSLRGSLPSLPGLSCGSRACSSCLPGRGLPGHTGGATICLRLLGAGGRRRMTDRHGLGGNGGRPAVVRRHDAGAGAACCRAADETQDGDCCANQANPGHSHSIRGAFAGDASASKLRPAEPAVKIRCRSENTFEIRGFGVLSEKSRIPRIDLRGSDGHRALGVVQRHWLIGHASVQQSLCDSVIPLG
jgi:hypothetical protein